MTHLRNSPELEVNVHDNIIIRTQPLECRDSFLSQRWENKKLLGRGGDGIVVLQQKFAGPGAINLLAVKAMQLKADLHSEDHDSKRYVRELEALAKFTQGKVSWVTTLFHSLLMLSAVCASLCENIRLVSRWGLALHLHGALQALGPWNLLENSYYCVRRNSQGDCSASPPRAVQNA
jgi:hypothetical protein